MPGDIYQEIWDADQQYRGVRALRAGQAVDDDARRHGYVVVDERTEASGRDHRVLAEVAIPAEKEDSYQRVARLFNNYTLDQTKDERDFPDEEQEVQEFLEAIHRCPPMEVARDYAARQSGREISHKEWWSILQRTWFEQFNDGGNRDLSGFEHVMVGEQKKGKVQGYHFWYKYHLDEHFRAHDAEGGAELDLLDFLTWKGRHGEDTPDVVTFSYVWRAFDYEARQFRRLTKPIGGFWVGPSAEGQMAIATIRFLGEAQAPRTAVINGHRYNLPVYRSPNKRNLRSFFPEYVGPAESGPGPGVITRAGVRVVDPDGGRRRRRP